MGTLGQDPLFSFSAGSQHFSSPHAIPQTLLTPASLCLCLSSSGLQSGQANPHPMLSGTLNSLLALSSLLCEPRGGPCCSPHLLQHCAPISPSQEAPDCLTDVSRGPPACLLTTAYLPVLGQFTCTLCSPPGVPALPGLLPGPQAQSCAPHTGTCTKCAH